MYFKIRKEKIINLLSKFNSYVKDVKNNSILSNILLILKKNKLNLIITDFNIEINYFILLNKGEFFKDGSITVNLNKFYELCRSYPKNSIINICFFNKRLNIFCLNSKSFLCTLPIDNFPLLNKNILFNYNFKISKNILKNIISYIYFSIGDQDIYYYLNGMLIEFVNNFFYFVTTDSYRISIYKLLDNFKCDLNIFFSLIISKKLVLELFKLLNFFESNNVYFYFNSSIVKIKFNNFIIYSSLIDGSFPDYKNILVIFKNYLYIDINLINLKNALIRSSIINGNLSNYVTFIFNNNYLLIYSNDNNNNEIKEKILINNYSKLNLEISFNIKYILDIVKVFSNCFLLRFYIKDSYSIIKIINLENKFLSYMVMPIQL